MFDRSGLRWCLLFLSLMLLVGCSSPQEKAQAFYDKGMALLEKEQPVKAELEFRNAIQLQQKMTKAWYGMVLVAEKQADWKKMFGLINKVLELEPKHFEAQVKRGRLLLAAGQIDQALEVSKDLLQQQANDADALALHAAVLLKREDYPGAVKQAKAALAQSPKHIDALVVLATERLMAKDPKAAIEILDKGLASDEKNIALQLIKIQALNNLDQFDAAEGVFKRLIALYPKTQAFRLSLARFYLQHDKKAEAEQQFRAIAQASPEDFNAKLELVRFVNSLHGPEKAVAEVNAMIAREPKNTELSFLLVGLYQQQNSPKLMGLLKALAENPEAETQVRAKAMMASLHYRKGEKEQSRVLVDQILQQDPRNEQALLIKASMEMDGGKLDAAIGDLRTILRDVPDSARALLLLAKAHELAGQSALAEDNYARAFEAGKKSPQFGMPYVRYLLNKGKTELAQTILKDLLATQPNHVGGLTLLARLQIDGGDLDGAQQTVERLSRLKQRPGEVDRLVGAIEAGRKNYQASIDAFEKAFEASEQKDGAMVSLVQTYVRADRKEDAKAFLLKVLSDNPANHNARILLGQLYGMDKVPEQAEAAFKEVLKQDGGNLPAAINLSRLYTGQGKYKEALAVVEGAVKAKPDHTALRLSQAGLLERLGRYDEAIAVYRKMVAANPKADVVANNLASLLTDHKGDPASLDEAFKLAKRFEGSKIPHFRDTLGWLYLKQGDAVKAVEQLLAAVKIAPDAPLLHYHLGMAYKAQNDAVKAKQALEKSKQLMGERTPSYRAEVEAALQGL